MAQLGESLKQLGIALLNVLDAFFEALGPWWPLILGLGAWVVFWLFAVNWLRLREVLASGGWTGVVLIAVMWILVWGVVAPPEDGRHHLLGLSVSNFVGKTVYVTALVCIMLLCGSVQLSGLLGSWGTFREDEEPADHAAHGHDSHAHVAHAHDAGHGHH